MDRKTSFLKKLGARLRYHRRVKDITQEKLGFKCKLDKTYISAVERGNRNISIYSLKQILDALDISLEDFFKDISK